LLEVDASPLAERIGPPLFTLDRGFARRRRGARHVI
jgi:hypothetical protein